MKSILGFGRTEEDTGTDVTITEEPPAEMPRCSLVNVRFPGKNRTYSYYNDLFDLHEGDLVFVSGKLAGERGVVDSVNYRFKINPAAYQRVIGRIVISMKGTYAPILDKMISIDREAVAPETFRSWVMPPADDVEPTEYITGEGYSFDLEHFAECPEVEEAVLNRALDYCTEGRVCYLSVRDHVGTAFVEGTKWYQVDFRYEDGYVRDMYCECPYPGLCKHCIAILITLREILKRIGDRDFTAMTGGFFIQMMTAGRQRIMLLPPEDGEQTA